MRLGRAVSIVGLIATPPSNGLENCTAEAEAPSSEAIDGVLLIRGVAAGGGGAGGAGGRTARIASMARLSITFTDRSMNSNAWDFPRNVAIILNALRRSRLLFASTRWDNESGMRSAWRMGLRVYLRVIKDGFL